MRNYLKNMSWPRQVIIEDFDPGEPFLDFAARFAADEGTVLLAGGGHADIARYHILAAFPWLTLTSRGDSVRLNSPTGRADFTLSPFTALKTILTWAAENHIFSADFSGTTPQDNQHSSGDGLPGLGLWPVTAGLFGYFAYDMKDCLEELPHTVTDDLALPDCFLIAPRLIVLHDIKTGGTVSCLHDFPDNPAENTRLLLTERRSAAAPCLEETSGSGRFSSNFTSQDYLAAVRTIIDYISAGDVYQVNLSQRFETDLSGHPYHLFCRLFDKNPAPFYAYINAGDHHLVSTSPERFLKLQGNRVETRPIKGTRPRGKTPRQDLANRQELLASTKDQAELAMIVDLLRNDLGRVCRGGSVRVTEHKKLEAYDNVFHLVSIIEGELCADKDAADLLAATFPGGSITGCPKIRAMEIIDELESSRRHIYTGSIGYVGFHGTMDLSIAIRTATVLNGRLLYSAGGGIVFDSDPADEFQETLAKADTLLNILPPPRENEAMVERAWVNGRLRPMNEATVPLDAPGFQYGAGLFETIRAENGEPLFLNAHLERFRSSWAALFDTPVPDTDWSQVIRQVIKANQLEEKTAAVKIMAAHGRRRQPPWDHTLAVTARPYRHRLSATNKNGLDLVVYPHPRQTPIASHKTLNYLYYHAAGAWAASRGADEAIILNPDGTVSETNTANILLINNKAVSVPISDTVLPGIMQQVVLKLLASWQWEIRETHLTPQDFIAAEGVLLTNSLMGTVPVLRIDGKKTGTGAAALCRTITKTLHPVASCIH